MTSKLSKLKLPKISAKIVVWVMLVVTLLLAANYLLAKHRHQQALSEAEVLKAKVAEWQSLQQSAKISPKALNYSVGRIEAEFNDLKKRFAMPNSQLTFLEAENAWRLRIPVNNGQSVMRMIERLEQLGLTLTQLELSEDAKNKKQVSGEAKLIMLWDWHQVMQSATESTNE